MFFCFLIGLSGCSKEEELQGQGAGYTGSPRIHAVIVKPLNDQSITLKNSTTHGDIDFGSMYISHDSDTITYQIPINTIVSQDSTVQFAGSVLGFQIDTIQDVIYLNTKGSNVVVSTWKIN